MGENGRRAVRERIASTDWWIDQLAERVPRPEHGVFQIVDLGNFPTGPLQYFAAYPVRVTGELGEGNTAEIDANTTGPCNLLGVASLSSKPHIVPVLPQPGDYVIAKDCGGRLCFELKNAVECSITVTISNCLPAKQGTWQLSASGSSTAGAFTLGFQFEATAPIQWNASASDVQNALTALGSIGNGNLVCAGGPLPGTTIDMTLTGDLAGTTQSIYINSLSLTPNTATMVIRPEPGNVPQDATATLTSDETQAILITGKPTGGTFKLSWGGDTTAPLAHDATSTDIVNALVGLSSIGKGNLVGGPGVFPTASGLPVTFQDDLAGTKQPLITATANFTGDDKATVKVTELRVGGTTLGPIDIDGQTGVGVFDVVPPGQWELEVDSDGYESIHQTIVHSCASGLTGGGQMRVEDGKIVSPGNPKPVDAPSTASLSGDPAGCSSLDLRKCTGGIATYVGTGGPQTVKIGTLTWTRQSWFIATFGCAETLNVVWTMYEGGFLGPCQPTSDAPLRCFPPEDPGDERCDFCACANSWWGALMPGNPSIIPCGPCPGPVPCGQGNLGVVALAGGGCFGVSMVESWSGPQAPLVPGYAGIRVNAQATALWGNGFTLTSVPCISASL